MWKRKITFMFLLFLFLSSNAINQELYNYSFEEWYINGFDQHPVGWTSSNDFSLPIGFPGVNLSDISNDGLYSARIITTNIGFAGAPYAGFIVNGEMNVSGHYDIDSIYKAGEPFPFRPDALMGYYKYESDAIIEDWAQAFVILKKYDSINQKVDTIGYGENKLLNPTSDFRYFTVDIDYYMDDILPDSIVVAFFSTYPRNPISGGRLWIDNITLEYATGTRNLPKDEEVIIYPDPVNKVLRVNSRYPVFINIYSVTGSHILKTQGESNIDINGLKPGLYIYVAKSQGKIYKNRFVLR